MSELGVDGRTNRSEKEAYWRPFKVLQRNGKRRMELRSLLFLVDVDLLQQVFVVLQNLQKLLRDVRKHVESADLKTLHLQMVCSSTAARTSITRIRVAN